MSTRVSRSAPLFVLLLGSLACQTVERQQSGALPHFTAARELFPPAHEPLVVTSGDANGPTFRDLVDAFVAVTDLRLVVDDATRQQLESQSVGLSADTRIPPASVYGVVEGLLFDQGYLLRTIHAGEPPVLGLSYRSRHEHKSSAFEVPQEDVLAFSRQHPALLMTTQVVVENVDARQLATSLRGLMTDTNTQTLIAAGEKSLRLTSPGRAMANIVETVLAADASGKEEGAAASEDR